MKLRLCSSILALGFWAPLVTANAQQQPLPAGVPEAMSNLVSQTPTHTQLEFDHDMLQGLLNAPMVGLNSVTFEMYRYHEPAFYTPEGMVALVQAYDHAGWHHLVNGNASPRDSTMPHHALTDMWLHFHGSNIDGCTVLIRDTKQMNVIEVSGLFRPLDLVRLGGHFGIPKVDPGAVMVPAPPGK